ncbi:Hypothetical_protein [Hexamita inflata]|uniref:Hypothetical_protein n=1 Tax=Hexamita inflata TaxID=28002 RepID=A0AA86NXH8_9EUKA|nr:Hypothetical protein HINF_LOCUS14828 [Hexamita inflata]
MTTQFAINDELITNNDLIIQNLQEQCTQEEDQLDDIELLENQFEELNKQLHGYTCQIYSHSEVKEQVETVDFSDQVSFPTEQDTVKQLVKQIQKNTEKLLRQLKNINPIKLFSTKHMYYYLIEREFYNTDYTNSVQAPIFSGKELEQQQQKLQYIKEQVNVLKQRVKVL